MFSVKQADMKGNTEWPCQQQANSEEDKLCIRPDEFLQADVKFLHDSDSRSSCTSPISHFDHGETGAHLAADDSDLADDSTSAARLSSSSLVSVTSASTSSFYSTNINDGAKLNRDLEKSEQTEEKKDDKANANEACFKDRFRMSTVMQSQLNDLCSTVEEKDRQLRATKIGLQEKDLEIEKLCEKIKALENNCKRLQSVVESVRCVARSQNEYVIDAGVKMFKNCLPEEHLKMSLATNNTIIRKDEADQNEMKLKKIIGERDGLLLRNASLSRQIEFEKREWSIEREILSMELEDVIRELELQKMILNGEKISEIVQRWQTKVFELEGMISDRDRAIRAQQQCISKLKHLLAEADYVSCNDSFESQTKLDSIIFTPSTTLSSHKVQSGPTEECIQMLQSVSNELHFSDEDIMLEGCEQIRTMNFIFLELLFDHISSGTANQSRCTLSHRVDLRMPSLPNSGAYGNSRTMNSMRLK